MPNVWPDDRLAHRGPRVHETRDGSGVPEKQTHDYVRNGTTTLFAALEVATGRIEQTCLPRHRH
jgi:hypothetical protein